MWQWDSWEEEEDPWQEGMARGAKHGRGEFWVSGFEWSEGYGILWSGCLGAVIQRLLMCSRCYVLFL